MTGVTIEDSSPYAQPSSGDAQPNSGDAQPSSGDAQLSSGDAQLDSGGVKRSSADAQHTSADAQRNSADAQRSSADVKPSSGDDAFISQYVSRLSKEKQRQLVEVAKTIMGKPNATRSMRDEVIVRICSIAPLSTYEISSLIKGNSAYTRIMLKRLMATGKLRYVHPDRPNHPQQRYIAAENGAVDEGRV